MLRQMIPIEGSPRKFIRVEYINLIEFITKKLSSSDITWVLTGSMNHALQGVDIVPKDIDLLSNKRGVYLIEKTFEKYNIIKRVTYSISENIRSYHGMLNISGINVDIMGEIENLLSTGKWESHENWENNIRRISGGECHIPVLSLEYEYNIYKKLNKFLHAQKIFERIKKGNFISQGN